MINLHFAASAQPAANAKPDANEMAKKNSHELSNKVNFQRIFECDPIQRQFSDVPSQIGERMRKHETLLHFRLAFCERLSGCRSCILLLAVTRDLRLVCRTVRFSLRVVAHV